MPAALVTVLKRAGLGVAMRGQTSAEVRILERHLAGAPDQPVAKHQAVLFVGKFAGQGAWAGNGLEGGFEQACQGVANGAGDAAEHDHAEGHVGHDLDRGAACLVHDAHGGPGQDQDGEHEQYRAQPLPALQLLRGKGVGDQGGHEAAECHGGNGRHVVARGVDGRCCIEDAEQAVRVLVSVDLPHGIPCGR